MTNHASLNLISSLDRSFAERFPRRFFGKQKEQFVQALDGELQSRGFATERFDFRTVGFRNRVLATRCEKPAVIFLAHYDTPMMMPFWISPIYTVFGHTRQVASTLFLVLCIWCYPLIPALLPQTSFFQILFSLLTFVLIASFFVMLLPHPL